MEKRREKEGEREREGGRRGRWGRKVGELKKILVFVLKETTQTTQRQLLQCG